MSGRTSARARSCRDPESRGRRFAAMELSGLPGNARGKVASPEVPAFGKSASRVPGGRRDTLSRRSDEILTDLEIGLFIVARATDSRVCGGSPTCHRIGLSGWPGRSDGNRRDDRGFTEPIGGAIRPSTVAPGAEYRPRHLDHSSWWRACGSADPKTTSSPPLWGDCYEVRHVRQSSHESYRHPARAAQSVRRRPS